MTRSCDVLTLTLAASLCAVAMPTYVIASDDGTVPPEQELMLNGRSWSQLLARNVAAGARLRLSPSLPTSGQTREATGQIRGVALSAEGQPLAGQLVELVRPRGDGAGRLIETTAANGEFAYAGLRPGRYEVYLRLRVNNRVVARSGAIELVEGRMQATGVTLSEPGRPSRSRGAAMAIGVAAGAGVGALVGLLLAVAAG